MKKKENKLELIGITWEELNFKLLDVVSEIINTRKMEGSTYIGIAKALWPMQIPTNKCDEVNGIVYAVRNLNPIKDKAEQLMKEYRDYDNAITVTVGENNGYVTNTILVNSKNSHYFILLGYPKEKENELDYRQMQKRLK